MRPETAHRMPAERRFAPRLRRSLGLLLILALVPSGPLSAFESVTETGMKLTTPVRQQLKLLHNAWQSWIGAYDRGDREAADMALARLQSISEQLSLARLPDLSAAAAAFAVTAAQEGDFKRARWALATARELDAGRPENEFAEAAVHRLEGDTVGAAMSSLRGYLSLLQSPLERGIWLHNLGLWLLLTSLLGAGVFVAWQLATKGVLLYHEFLGLFSPRISRPAADLMVLAVLVWPLFLPSGAVWLALYWSVLLWGYGSLSEKVVFVALWLVLGVTPIYLAAQQRSVQLALSPPTRVIDNLENDRLYGALFADLSVLRTRLGDHPAVTELVADLHRRFGQWTEARPLYVVLAEESEQAIRFTSGPLNNLGLYHLQKKDFGTAVNYFQRAIQADPSSTEAHYNLSLGYSQLFEFSRSNDALEQAKLLDREQVESWEQRAAASEESGIASDGGLRRTAEIRLLVSDTWRAGDRPAGVLDFWRRHFSLSVIVATILLAVTLHQVRRQLSAPAGGVPSTELELHPVIRALTPGLESAQLERGGRALCAILVPVALATLPLMRGFGYRSSLGFDPGGGLPAAALAALAVLFIARLGWELKGRRGDG